MTMLSPVVTGSTIRVAAAVALTLVGSVSVRAQVSEEQCGPLVASFGPFDYRPEHFRPAPGDPQPHAEKLYLVEKAHFTPKVESLTRGESTNLPGPDLEYTLRVFPNHHRALASVLRLWERSKQPTPVGLTKPAECYFERAVRFRPKDNVARMFYASYLIKASRVADATGILDAVRQDAGDSAFTHYNLGLLYTDVGLFDKALAQAHRSMDLGLMRPELQQRLVALGRWKDPPPTAAQDAASHPPSGGASGASPTEQKN
jgi:hypothetical protein